MLLNNYYNLVKLSIEFIIIITTYLGGGKMPNSKAYGEAAIDTGSTGLNSQIEKSTMWKDFTGTYQNWNCQFKSHYHFYWNMAGFTF